MCKKCFFCDEELNENTLSKEHIIKNSIGGKRTAKNFICKKCNEKTGQEWDYLIDKDFGEILSVLFQIKRDRGKIKPMKVEDTATNHSFLVSNKIEQITPEYLHDVKSGKITITALNEKRCKQYLNQLKSKNEIPNDTTLDSTERIKDKVEINFESNLNIPELTSNFSKSVIKSALALLSEYQDDNIIKSCNLAKSFFNGENNNCIEYFYDYDPIINRPFAVPLHCVYIFNKDNTLKAYIELFGIARYIVKLSNQYTNNKNIKLLYAINPRNAFELKNLKFNFQLQKNVKDCLHPGAIHEMLNKEIFFEKESEKIFIESIQKALGIGFKNPEELSKIMTQFYKKDILSKSINEIFFTYATKKFELLLNNFYKEIYTKSKKN